jgi:hypothetical protein
LLFQGDFRATIAVFRRATLAKRRPRPSTLLAYARARFDPRREGELSDVSETTTNRVYLTADLA